MDKKLIEKFSKEARIQLLEKVKAKAVENYIEKDIEADENLESINGIVLDETRKNQRRALIQRINKFGYEQVMEEVAYTWFNRFLAIRYMEVNGYLPSHIRVFSDDDGKFKPQIMSEALSLELPGLDVNKVIELKSNSKDEDLFKYLLLIQCNALNEILPYMFSKIEDYTELLLPDFLLREGSVVERLVKIPEENFKDIEILGWAYQYYISDKHEEVVDPLHGKVVRKEEVPAATQLFTTDWVVKYLVDNSLGRYWIERNAETQLSKDLEYFVAPQKGNVNLIDENITPQDVTVFDPCVGSGHFLVYAFDVLMKIYVEYGFSERDAASEIVKNNIFGLDIDGRATQLAYFAIMMKARQYDRRFFTRGIHPKIYEIVESNNVDKSSVNYFCGNDQLLKNDVDTILNAMSNAKEYGSIIQVPKVDFERINKRISEINEEMNMYSMYLLEDFKDLLNVYEVLSNQYAIVDTNPPYLNKYDAKLKEYINSNYSDYKGDLFSVFIYRNFLFCKENGYCSFMTPMVWMFIQMYERLRAFLINQKQFVSLIQFEYSAFEEATVPICAFVLKNNLPSESGYYFRLSDFKGGMKVQNIKTLEAINNRDCGWYYETNQEGFLKIPSTPIAYWVSNHTLKLYDNQHLSKYVDCKSGIMTGSDTYIKLWHEPSITRIKFDCEDVSDMGDYQWFPLNSGGGFRKWFGNNQKVVDLYHGGEHIQKNVKNYRLRDTSYYFKRGITWGRITSCDIAFRDAIPGSLFGDAGPIGFINEKRSYVLGFLSSCVVKYLLNVANPTLNFQVHDIMELPLIISNEWEKIEQIVNECIELSRKDWDSFETSWNFRRHPILCESNKCSLIKDSFESWEEECDSRFYRLMENEERINKFFIDEYGLNGEISYLVEEKDITVSKADLNREVRSLISYAVGCMFGRYSLDSFGIVYAGGDWDETKYTSFIPDGDAIIPICDDEYFDDDIVGRFIKFIEIAFGKEKIEENLQFIANAIGGNGPAREVIRDYFINDFYADHLKVYQKRPIYWLFDSGKKNGFKCLIYMHRYQQDTIARIRTDYVHEQQARYRTAIEEITNRIEYTSGSDKVKLTKKLNTLKAQNDEIHAYEEKIHHLADQMISIDLDDGVKVNYAKFKDVLAKIK